MHARRKAARIAVLGIVPAALVALPAVPAGAHGSMHDPVSRVSACFAENPESPDSPACKALVAMSGTQPLYDWNEVNLPAVNGQHRQAIPDGKLCSAGRDKYKGLDMPRTDWPSSRLTAGKHDFRYRVTAKHRGTMELYMTKPGYDPTKPLKWSDLESTPFATTPTTLNAPDGYYHFSGNVPARTGRHLIYGIWQRTDSPEAFYLCSDVVFGNSAKAAKAAKAGPLAKAPTERQIAAGAEKSTVRHDGMGMGDAHGSSDDSRMSMGGAAAVAGAAATALLFANEQRRRRAKHRRA
ncbi:lytic polysaccharide monooxygenase [Streptomyces sp. SAJ15]|uniref:lytic polysaccharide monooxygenase auxiliary activity family 9 protein n=1 Tax=Streptomyces sp. SAJ15 TaxID=2011095 RepID=UPI001185B16C|nr:lytic polysaccharide monooxygenase [Streptomyces sp. SAJ15]TVL90674.1 chitin-binding protein [Streptomyces sp. SAJ15]